MRVLLFGIVAEKAGSHELDLEASSLAALRDQLHARIPGLVRMSYAIAVDCRIVKEDAPLTGSEEIAVLPPFAGG
ncbi:MAG: MoaD/ThiS family protein [Flavobacteriales bacterium]